MTEKTPIEPDEIQAGDVIRFEWDEPREDDPAYGSHAAWAAAEYRATHDGSTGGFQLDEGKYYIVQRPERPESPVPTDETLGWLHYGNRLHLGVWRTHDYKFTLDDVGRSAIQWERDIPVDQVTGFTPAIAVAVDEDGTAAAAAWADYRKDYGISRQAVSQAHKAFLAGWAARTGDLDAGGPQR